MSKVALKTHPALLRPDLLAEPVRRALESWRGEVAASEFEVVEIDPQLSDTEAFCAHYDKPAGETANTVIIEAVRGGERRLAVVVMSAAGRADLNGKVRKLLGARRVSLAPKDEAVSASKQEYGSITVFGLPADWPIIVDAKAAQVERLLMGGGLRRSKLLFPGRVLAELPNAQVVENLGRE
jgi:prolyl-tRNA editing enzyme YbaK/EbsC (Cys-tRNA(Pro) deacylase)